MARQKVVRVKATQHCPEAKNTKSIGGRRAARVRGRRGRPRPPPAHPHRTKAFHFTEQYGGVAE